MGIMKIGLFLNEYGSLSMHEELVVQVVQPTLILSGPKGTPYTFLTPYGVSNHYKTFLDCRATFSLR